ncbi:MAG: hypothetical protein HS128_09665 [Ideonella sp.]|nr:hypothetical protein [Ideonella sp.]
MRIELADLKPRPKGETAMGNRKARKTALKVVRRDDRAAIGQWLAGNGQALLPMLELLENAQASIDELMNEAARGLIEQLLVLSAQELAGAKIARPCRRRRGVGGTQRGQVTLAERRSCGYAPAAAQQATSKRWPCPRTNG